MTLLDFLLLIFGSSIYYGILTWKFYQAAGKASWSAFIPFYGTYVLTQIIQRPVWWTILFYIPVVGNVMGIVSTYELFHVFKFHKLKYTILSIITGGLYLGYMSYTAKLEYAGRDIKSIRKHVSELGASLMFAVVAATIIRAFTFEAFTIPTPSMEKSMMVGDFLFVSKLQYGSRLPITPLAIPLVHNKIPLTDKPSYSSAIQFPYIRLPKISEVERLDPVVFNYPMESEKPIDKREHYVKRCVAIPGDELSIVDGQVFVNGDSLHLPDRALPQFNYTVVTKDKVGLNPKYLKENFDINYVPRVRWKNVNQIEGDVEELRTGDLSSPIVAYKVPIPSHHLEAFKSLPNVISVERVNTEKNPSDYPKDISKAALYINNIHKPSNQIFPNPAHGEITFDWTRDNYGPIYMPQKGDNLELTKENFLKFRRIIEIYEENDLEIRDGKYFINGEESTHYTFKQGYYWMMGDNRHNSLDSRYWGYVPENHVVGKPVFIWMSYDKYASGLSQIRTDRVFTTVNGSGERTSYFWPFIIVVVAFTTGNNFRKNRKKKKEAA